MIFIKDMDVTHCIFTLQKHIHTFNMISQKITNQINYKFLSLSNQILIHYSHMKIPKFILKLRSNSKP